MIEGFAGFESIDAPVSGATIHARQGGSGEPLLLLHGYPQTHVMWHPIAAELAKTHRVIAADLRGYGDSTTESGDFTFRAMARDQVELMRALGHETFHVVAHDRGARTTHRMALDHPDALRSIALLDILPTLDMWRLMDGAIAQRYWHWVFLIQPDGLPQRLIDAAPEDFVRASLGGLPQPPPAFTPEAIEAYVAAARKPSVVRAWCGDYTAAAGPDLEHDRADLGRTVDVPALVMWGANGLVGRAADPMQTWRAWFPRATGRAVDAGHFLVEENPTDVLAGLREHLDAATGAESSPPREDEPRM